MVLEDTDLDGIVWTPGHAGRVWFAQPHLTFGDREPWTPTVVPGRATGIELLRAILSSERDLPDPVGAPSLILIPELSIPHGDVAELRRLIGDARPNTLLIAGLAQLSELQALEIDPAPLLWEGKAEGRFTNCAAIACGGSERLFLQPKRIPSKWEGKLWPGGTIRYFSGKSVQFCVVICSELLDQPEGTTTIRALREECRARGKRLPLLVWLQHNEHPRSALFSQSLEIVQKWTEVTTLIAGSRPRSRSRMENYGVSGALVRSEYLPRKFDFLAKEYHYFEPVSTVPGLSRMVLLRYDADVYRVDTVLADSIDPAESSAIKGALFHSALPYDWQGGELTASQFCAHLADVTEAALLSASAACERLPEIAAIRERLVALGTAQFLHFLDRATPNQSAISERHPAGEPHISGDAFCRCWPHRRCIDELEIDPRALSDILTGLAWIEAAGVTVVPEIRGHANVELRGSGLDSRFCVVAALDLNAEAVENAIWPGWETRPPIDDVPYIVLGTEGRGFRPRVSTITASNAAPVGAPSSARVTSPMRRAIYAERFWQAARHGSLLSTLTELAIA